MGPDSAAQAASSLDIDTEAVRAAFAPSVHREVPAGDPEWESRECLERRAGIADLPAHGLTPVFTTNDLPTKAYYGVGLVVARAG